MNERLSLGFSPCPNDCFIFYALVHGKVEGPAVEPYLADVEELNRLALAGHLDITKLSYHAFGHVRDRYSLLSSGGALGEGVGPLIVTRTPLQSLSGRTVAIPGGLTTANLLMKLSQPDDLIYRELRYDRIMPAVASGEVDAGLIIHESRFTYQDHGLLMYADLGEWWQSTTGQPIPLGGIVMKRDFQTGARAAVDEAIRASLEYAWAHPEETAEYVAQHAQEMGAEVRSEHIRLYVNEYSRDLGSSGRKAVAELLGRAQDRKLIPAVAENFFAS